MTRMLWVREAPQPDGSFGPGPDHIFVDVRQNGYEREACISVCHETDAGPLVELEFTPLRGARAEPRAAAHARPDRLPAVISALQCHSRLWCRYADCQGTAGRYESREPVARLNAGYRACADRAPPGPERRSISGGGDITARRET